MVTQELLEHFGALTDEQAHIEWENHRGELSRIQGSLSQNGWKIELRMRLERASKRFLANHPAKQVVAAPQFTIDLDHEAAKVEETVDQVSVLGEQVAVVTRIVEDSLSTVSSLEDVLRLQNLVDEVKRQHPELEDEGKISDKINDALSEVWAHVPASNKSGTRPHIRRGHWRSTKAGRCWVSAHIVGLTKVTMSEVKKRVEAKVVAEAVSACAA